LQRNSGSSTLIDMTTPAATVETPPATSALPDSEIVKRVCGGDRALFEVLMRRYNQRVYRTARAIVRDEGEAEDVMQQAYVNAFTHLGQFEARSRFSTWLTQIVVNEALARRQKLLAVQTRTARLEDEQGSVVESLRSTQPDPERQAYAGELQRALEEAVDSLPEAYRTVFMLRDIEGMSTAETGEGLGLGDEAVKTRLHRARAMVRRALAARIGAAASIAFQFPATRCDRVVLAVLERLPATVQTDLC
jgi:RNA polymerase sigma-70 factor, ECF subfamily